MMNASHTASATIELPVILSELGNKYEPGPSSPRSPQRSPKADDVENIGSPCVIGREAGERDPLLFRSKVVSDDEIDGFRQ